MTISRTAVLALLLPVALAAAASPARGESFYLTDLHTKAIERFTPGQPLATVASGLAYPFGVAFAPDGTLYVADNGGGRIDRVNSDGSLSRFADLSFPTALAFDHAGNLYAGTSYSGTITKITPAGALSTIASGLGHDITGLGFDSHGNLFASAYAASAIDEIDPAGHVSLFASVYEPDSLAVGPDDAVYAPHWFNSLTRITPDHVATTYDVGLDKIAFGPDGTLYGTDTSDLYRISATGVATPLLTVPFPDHELLYVAVEPVPEPATAGLLALAAVALLGRKRR